MSDDDTIHVARAAVAGITAVAPTAVPAITAAPTATGTVILTGIPGPPGPEGPPGPGAAGSFVFVQSTPSVTWVIDHPLDFTPNVTVVDSAGTQVEGQVDYPSAAQIVLTFSAAFSGKAYLS